MSIYPWDENYVYRKVLSAGNGLPDYNLDPPDDEKPDLEGIDVPDNWEETCQMLGLHS